MPPNCFARNWPLTRRFQQRHDTAALSPWEPHYAALFDREHYEKHVNAIHMKGNDNAKKDEADKATALVQMRMTPEKKSRYVREAKRNGLTISAWIQRHMDQVCDESDVNYLKKKAGEQ